MLSSGGMPPLFMFTSVTAVLSPNDALGWEGPPAGGQTLGVHCDPSLTPSLKRQRLDCQTF